MVLLANSIAPWWCFACVVCGGAPDWPDQGVATRDWVVEALEWRLDRGLGDCEEYMPAIDAWTLEWSTTSPPPPWNFAETPQIASRRPLWDLKHPDDPDWKYE